MKYLPVVISLILSFGIALSAHADESKSSPRTIVSLLDYLAGDYSGAVKNGKITDPSEHKEHLELAASAVSLSRELPELKNQKQILEEILQVQKLVQRIATPEAVANAAQKAKTDVIKLTGLTVAPDEWPQLQRGRAVFEQNCVSCHGVSGHGDGVRAALLKPAPANFHDGKLMGGLSAFKIFNTVREGLPGTAMASVPTLSDKDVWAVAFYVESLRHNWLSEEQKNHSADIIKSISLHQAATLSDDELVKSFSGTEKDKKLAVAALRLKSPSQDSNDKTAIAVNLLLEAQDEYAMGDHKAAKQKSLNAYLEGIEPIEPKIKARDPKLLVEIEKNMAAVRGAMEENFSVEAVRGEISQALKTIKTIEQTIQEEKLSPSLTFTISASILLREAFEAVLVIIALLSVLRSMNSREAVLWVHTGWILAVVVGLIFWFFSGWLLQVSGASRELLEGTISLLAVFVLLFMGFWLHSKTEINRWNQFIKEQVQTAVSQGSLIGLGMISFMAVAREALEVVLFLRTIWIESGSQTEMKSAMLGGVVFAFVLVIFLAWALLKYSSRVPVRKLFAYTSSVMALLAFVLMGKSLHSIQEAGRISITLLPFDLRSDIFGFYPTLETVAAQVLLIIVIYTLWAIGKKPSASSV